LGFLCYDFLLLNKAICKLQLPFDYDTFNINATTGQAGPQAYVHAISPSTIQTILMFEKCFLYDMIQLMIQSMFLIDINTPNNYIVYCSVYLTAINFLLNMFHIFYLHIKNERRKEGNLREMNVRLEKLTTFVEE